MDTVPSEPSESDNSQPILYRVNGHAIYGVPSPDHEFMVDELGVPPFPAPVRVHARFTRARADGDEADD